MAGILMTSRLAIVGDRPPIADRLGNPQQHLAALEQRHIPINKEATERLAAESCRRKSLV